MSASSTVSLVSSGSASGSLCRSARYGSLANATAEARSLWRPTSADDSLSFLLAHPNKPTSRKQAARYRTTADLIAASHRQLRLGILTDGIPSDGGAHGVSSSPLLLGRAPS